MQTGQTIPHPIKILRLSWQESSTTRHIDELRSCKAATDTSTTQEQATNGEALSHLDFLPGKETGFGLPLERRHDQLQLCCEDDSTTMVESPAGSCHGSTSQDKTPRIRPADTFRGPSPLRSPRHDISPHRQDSAYESIKGTQDEGSIVDVDTQARNVRARERVEILRGRVLWTRSVINEKRQEVQSLRERLRHATDKLMQVVNGFTVAGSSQEPYVLIPYCQAMREAHDELGPAEDDYDSLEIRLNREEGELEQEERHFYTHNNILLDVPPDSKLDKTLTPLVKPYQPQDSEFTNLDLENELVQEYFSKVAEAEHLKEEIYDLENEQYRLTEDLSFRTRVNLPLSEEKRTFLFDFPTTHKKLLEDLQTIEDNLYDLQRRCIDGRLFDESEHGYKPRDALIDEINESINDTRDRSPMWTSGPYRSTTHPDSKCKDKWDLNAWLLGLVRQSTVESLQLRAFIYFEYPRSAKNLDGEEWAELALNFWDRDETGESSNQKRVLSTMDALLGGTADDWEESLDVDRGYGAAFDEYIMRGEGGLNRTPVGFQDVLPEEVSSDQARHDRRNYGLQVANSILKASSV